MDKITISDGVTTIEMPRVRDVSVGGEEVCKEITMASGKKVKDIIGHRAVVSAAWDWLPAETISALQTMLRKGGYFTVSYPDPDGADKSGSFSISFPTPKVFKFNGTTPRWHGVSLKMIAQEVV